MPVWKIKMSQVNVLLWHEYTGYIKEALKKESDLDLVILPGIHRTGTSILFQCIHKTDGFKEKRELKLIGYPPSEHRLWRVANYMVSKYLGAKCFLHESARDLRMADFFLGPFNSRKPLDNEIKEEMDDLVGVLSWQGARVIKEPNCQFALQAFIDNYECFKNAKYIWTRRDSLETAKSLVRLKVPDREDLNGNVVPTMYRGKLKVKTAMKINEQAENLLARIMPSVNHIEVWHHDLINKPDETFDMISDFIGAKVNTELFNRKKTWNGRT